MSSSATLASTKRDKVGSRSARALRNAGRVPASLQADADHPHIDLSVDEYAFLTARRQHAHLFDLDFDGTSEAAVIRELQWDSMGDRILHVEFKRVVRGVATESEVALNFVGMVAEGVLTHSVTHLAISCIPSLIPDGIEVSVAGLTIGTHVRAKDLVLPEGISLAADPETEIAMISAPSGASAEEADSEEEDDEA
ncbi:MAG: large subunit ribosomal protein L25 [Planctomycetota bacterium]|jgi:large subunit ribosomal protein L25